MRNRAVVTPGFFNMLMVAAGGLIFHRAFAPFVRSYHFNGRVRHARQVTRSQTNMPNAEPVGLRASVLDRLLSQKTKMRYSDRSN